MIFFFCFIKVHICIERHCQNALQNCLEWIKEDVNSYNMFIKGVRHGNTVLHAGIYHSITSRIKLEN